MNEIFGLRATNSLEGGCFYSASLMMKSESLWWSITVRIRARFTVTQPFNAMFFKMLRSVYEMDFLHWSSCTSDYLWMSLFSWPTIGIGLARMFFSCTAWAPVVKQFFKK